MTRHPLIRVGRCTLPLALALVLSAAAQPQPEDAVLVGGERIGSVVFMGETLDDVSARLGPLEPLRFAAGPVRFYPLPTLPPLVIAVCDGSGAVIGAEMQQAGTGSAEYVTPEGIGMAADEVAVREAYGDPTEVRGYWDDGVLLLYDDPGLVFAFTAGGESMVALGIYRPPYLGCASPAGSD